MIIFSAIISGMERDAQIVKMLDEHYPADISFIPVTEPFRFLVTVMLSASTTDRQALLAAERLFAAFPDADAVAEASEEDIEALIHQAGLSHSKARNIKRSAEYIRQFGIPETEDGLVKLPGVGEKTAACYLVSVLNKPGVIADTHFVRVARRLGLTDTDDRARSAREIREKFDPSLWARISMTVNLHGRLVCSPRPECGKCFLSDICCWGEPKGTSPDDPGLVSVQLEESQV